MRKSYFLMHLAILLWGFTGIFGKAISMNEGMIVWYRMLISAAGMLGIIYWNKKSINFSAKNILKISSVGIIVCLHWIAFYGAIKISNVSITLSCFSSVALFTAIIEPLSEKKKPLGSELLLGIGVMVGIYVIFQSQQIYFWGIIIALISALFGSVFTVMNKKLMTTYEAEPVTFYELTGGFVFLSCLLPFYLTATNQHFIFPGLTDSVYLILLSLVCTSFAFTISLKALKKVNAFTMNLSVNLEPVYSIILAIIIFNEDEYLNTGFFVGTLIIISAVIVHSWYAFNKSKQMIKKRRG
ncbi:MAG: DMT family transporter [Bacteroidia bacterium]